MLTVDGSDIGTSLRDDPFEKEHGCLHPLSNLFPVARAVQCPCLALFEVIEVMEVMEVVGRGKGEAGSMEEGTPS